MHKNSNEENRNMYKDMKYKAKKAVAKAIREKYEEVPIEFKNCSYGMLILVKEIKVDRKEVEDV